MDFFVTLYISLLSLLINLKGPYYARFVSDIPRAYSFSSEYLTDKFV